MKRRIFAFLVALCLLISALPLPTFATGNIIINGVNIGYANKSYFTKDGKSCKNTYWLTHGKKKYDRCHHNDVCEDTTHAECNCMRYWPKGDSSNYQVDLLGSQCLAFARYCQWKVYGSFATKTSATYSDLTGTIAASACTGENLKAKLYGCAPATHVRMPSPHSISIVTTTANDITFADCNSDGYCMVRLETWDWNTFANYVKGKGGITYAYSRIGAGQPNIPDKNYVDIGTDFTAPILNKAAWKTIANSFNESAPPPIRIQPENGRAEQLWYFSRQTDGSYMISSCYDGKYMDVRNADTSMGAVVQTCEASGSDAQKWYLYEKNGGYVIKSKLSGYVLDLVNNDATSGNTLQTWENNGTDAQIWAIYPGDECKLKGPTLTVSPGNSTSKTIFTWNEVYGEKEYDVKIWKNEIWVGDAYHIQWNTSSGYSIQLPAGTYQAYVDAANHYDCKMSNVVTFTVKNAAQYTISYNANGGSGAPGNQTKTHGVNLTLSSTKPVRSGYTFLGWATSPTASTATYQPGAIYAKDANITLYAVWKAHMYTVSYNSNGGSNAPSSQTKHHGTALTLTTQKPTGKAYTISFNGNGGTVTTNNKQVSDTFLKWNTKANGSGISYSSGDTYSENTSVTLYAQWEAATLGNIQTPVRNGFTFAGWYTSPVIGSNGIPTGTEYTASSLITQNITLYALWISEDALFFGDYDRDGDVDFKDIVAYNNYIKGKLTPDYEFDEFLLRGDLDRDGEITANDLTIINKIQLHNMTQFEVMKDYIGTGINTLPKTNQIYGEKLDTTGLSIYIRFGDTFYCISDGLSVSGYDSHKLGNQKVTVSFYQFSTVYDVTVKNPTQYTISYNANGGSSAPSAQTKHHGTDLTLTTQKPTGKAYTITFNGNGGTVVANSKQVSDVFVEWNTMANGSGTTYSSGDTYSENASVTLYAQWEAAPLGGVQNPTRSGFTFAGWYTSPSVSHEGTPLGEKYTAFSQVTQNMTLYAIWISDDNLIFGDYDKDGKVDLADITAYNNYIKGELVPNYELDEFLLRGDLDRDEQITSNDLVIINQLRLNKWSQFDIMADYVGTGINTLPKGKQVYGEELNTKGLSIYIRFGNAFYCISDGLSITGYDPYKLGSQKITVKFHQFSTAYNVTVEPRTPLQITTQPQNVTVPNGSAVEVNVKATGDGLTYQWYYKNSEAASFSKSSQTTATYSVTMSDSVSGRQLYCKITDQYGNSINTNTVTLHKAADLVITQQPAKTVAVRSGETAKVTVKASGDGLKYQWFVKMPGSSSYVKGSQTGTAYSVTMNTSRNGMKVCCKVTDKHGRSKTSEVATLRMMTPLAITAQPTSITVLPGETARAAVKAAGDGLKYQWFVKMPTSSSYQKGSQTGATYSVKMTDARNGMKVYCKISDQYGNYVNSNTVTLKQAAALAITTQPKSVSVANGETARVTVKATGEGLKYQWFVKMPGSSSYVKGSQTGTTYAIAMNASRNGMKVCCKITDKYGRSKTSEVATLKQITPLAITTQPVSVTVQSGAAARVSVKATGEGLTYQWFVKMPGSSSYQKSSQTGTTYSVAMNASRNGMKVCCKVTDKYGKSITSSVATLKLPTPLAITVQPVSVTVANGAAAKVSVKAVGEGLKYQWFVKMPTSSSYQKSSQTGTTYSVAMNASRNGMKVCCKITDQYGNSVVTNSVTLKKG